MVTEWLVVAIVGATPYSRVATYSSKRTKPINKAGSTQVSKPVSLVREEVKEARERYSCIRSGFRYLACINTNPASQTLFYTPPELVFVFTAWFKRRKVMI